MSWTGYTIMSLETGVPVLKFDPTKDKDMAIKLAARLSEDGVKYEVWEWRLGSLVDTNVWPGDGNTAEALSEAS